MFEYIGKDFPLNVLSAWLFSHSLWIFFETEKTIESLMLNISTNFPVMINLHLTYYLQGKLPYRPAKHTEKDYFFHKQ